MTTTRSAAVLAAAACLAVLTGCASHAAAPGAGATRSPSTITTAPTSAPAGTPATTAPGGQASAPRCHTSQLSLAFTGLNAASGGQRGMSLILTNHSGSICHVYGYPGLAVRASNHAAPVHRSECPFSRIGRNCIRPRLRFDLQCHVF
jgi:Protein of unknown function (DUF4232)